VRLAATGLGLLLTWHTALASEPPPLVNVCWGYGCDRSARLIVPRPDWRAIRALMTQPAPDAATERRRVARAVALFERAVGRRTATSADRHGNLAGSGRPGQLDCIDESRNTAGYLRVLAARDLLRWHRVGPRHQRAPWIFDQHWTAVLTERDTGRRWAVDSWFLDNGERAYIQPLQAWLDNDALPPNPAAPDGPP
jgi:hypothetical protein